MNRESDLSKMLDSEMCADFVAALLLVSGAPMDYRFFTSNPEYSSDVSEISVKLARMSVSGCESIEDRREFLKLLNKKYEIDCRAFFNYFDINSTDLESVRRVRIAFFAKNFVQCFAPENFFFLNPEFEKKFIDTKGVSAVEGLANFWGDIAANNSNISLLSLCSKPSSPMILGKDVATSEGCVVYSEKILQLIRYDTSNGSAYSNPIILIPSWINKFYVFDLSPERSIVKWLVESGCDVFVISWFNPKDDDSELAIEDYIEAALRAVSFAKDASSGNHINIIGYCLGGSLSLLIERVATYRGLKLIGSITFVNSPLDCSTEGVVESMVTDEILARIDYLMEHKHVIPAEDVDKFFIFLKMKEMVWQYFINQYLLGYSKRASDVLYWNSDSVNVSPTLHAFVLKELYKNNKLMKKGDLKILDAPIDIEDICIPTYVVSTVCDHIVPWYGMRSAFASLSSSRGKRFVLAGSGHVMGVVNIPSVDKYSYAVSESSDASEIFEADGKKGSWWRDWFQWMSKFENLGYMLEKRLEIEDVNLSRAPGDYVMQR